VNSEEYNIQIRQWIAAAAGIRASISLNELVNTLPGVHPNDIAREFAALSGLTLTNEVARPTRRALRHTIKLPVPHPLEFDWRFTSETINFLLRRIEETGHSADGLCFLGAPALFRAALEHRLSKPFYLVDASVTCTQAFAGEPNKVFVTDLLKQRPPALRVGIVVTDPPWYEESIRAFLWAAAQLVPMGGTVLLSFPPIGTRPHIEDEWSRIKKFAEQLGLAPIGKSLSLKYASPPFEQNALRAARHQYIHPDWRQGVLVQFEKTGKCREPRPTTDTTHDKWTEQSIRGVRWKFRQQQQRTECRPLLIEAVPGDILDSVSRRDPRRATADVWTSGNRIFASLDTASLELIARAVAAGARPDTYLSDALGRQLTPSECRAVLLTANQIETITSRELSEYMVNWEE
jgi:hypothetical protein